MEPGFAELSRVCVIDPDQPPAEGYVVARQFRDGEWLYKVSIEDSGAPTGTFDNWYRENALSEVK